MYKGRRVQLRRHAFGNHNQKIPMCQFPAGFNSLAEWVRCSLKEQNSPPNMEGVVDPFLLQTSDGGGSQAAHF